MFDRSLLPPADLEFVVVGDTHYMPDPGAQAIEFESRRHQAARAERALRLIAQLAPAFVVHLGDVAQIPIEAPNFDSVVAAACAQFEECGVHPFQVAGNQDIGDKPDPTMPTAAVTPAILTAYHARFGRSWYSWQAGNLHCIVVNTQIMNTELPEASAQHDWLEEELRAHAGQRICLFLHLPLYLYDATEPDLGHYDNLGQPARRWLVDLIRRYPIELVCAGHSHFFFYDRLGTADYFVTPSTSHTRPGFSEAFASCPPDEQGRNDTAKLGFFLVRAQGNNLRVHQIRTYGMTEPDPQEMAWQTVIPRLAPDLPASPLGLVLRHPLTPVAEVPIAWPSVIRQRVRNDYPLLACLELGARSVRVPAADLEDPVQQQRLALLRAKGVHITATWLWSDTAALQTWLAAQHERIDQVEIQMPGTGQPPAECLAALADYRMRHGRPVTLAPIIARELVAGKQLPRTRLGYRVAELPELDAWLQRAGAQVERVLCRIEAGSSPWEVITQLRTQRWQAITAVDLIMELAGTDAVAQAAGIAEALFAAALLPGGRLFLEPLVDLDRTMDRVPGLLDRQCNPRSSYEVVRCLNTVLFHAAAERGPGAVRQLGAARLLELQDDALVYWLLLPLAGCEAPTTLSIDVSAPAEQHTPLRCYRLMAGMSQVAPGVRFSQHWQPALGPLLLVAPINSTLAVLASDSATMTPPASAQ